jgi:hypothetical protein
MAKALFSSEDLLVGGSQPESSVFKTTFIFFIFHGLYLVIPLLFVVGPFLMLLTSYRTYALVCIVCYWTWVFRDQDHLRYGRPWPFFENLPFIRYILEWLPMRILRTQELDPSKQYIFACHPHGTLAFNRAVVGFSTNTLWNKAFPNVPFRVLTARAAFFVPFIRELWLWTSCVDASREVATKVLRDIKSSIFVYPGGEKEQILTEYQKHKVFLSSRKGFVRLALREGAALVPVYAFGETDLYHHSQFALSAREYLVKNFGVSAQIFFVMHFSYVSLFLLLLNDVLCCPGCDVICAVM